MLTTARIGYGLFLAGVMGLLQPSLAQEKAARDWPVFRGNARQTGVAESTLPPTLEVSWSFNASDVIEAAPIVLEQTVLVGVSNGKLFALDLTTGKKKWEYQTGGIRAAAAARSGSVYIGDAKGAFHCVDVATGKKQWSVAAAAEIGAAPNFAGNNVIFGSNDHHLYSVSADGKIAWKCKTKEKIRASPAVVDDRILVAGCDQAMHIIDATNGTLVGSIPLGAHAGASVAVHGNHAYVGNMANRFLSLDWKKNTVNWHFEAKKGAQGFLSSAAVTDEWIVVGSKDKYVHALNRQTGKEVWTFATKRQVDSSPVIVGERVIVGSLDGNLYILDLARGTKLAHFELGPIPSSPAVAGQRVVVATFYGEVFCLGAKK